ncbi:hypothetical protein PCANB_001769 [Pneumocystis canis]|nr:hypothetical protein PCANB_001769 [Pneumocystis canis]
MKKEGNIVNDANIKEKVLSEEISSFFEGFLENKMPLATNSEEENKEIKEINIYPEKNDIKGYSYYHSQSFTSDTSSNNFSNNKHVKDPLIKHKRRFLLSSWTNYSNDSVFQELELDNYTYITITGYNINKYYLLIYYILCLITGGFLFLILLWFPKWKIWLIYELSPLDSCNWVVIKDKYNKIEIIKVKRENHGHLIFSVYKGFQNIYSKFETKNDDSEIPPLVYFDYRYLRFIYYPPEQKFLPLSNWRDYRYTLPIEEIFKGLDTKTRNDREIIFGKNIMDIEEKSIFRLLIDEIVHYFYIFLIFSVTLWMFDSYYYYASCILIISIINIILALAKTKKNIRSLRMMSRYVTDVRVLRDGAWIVTLSSELVPGDIFDISYPGLVDFPCNSILLTGDCIVNESSLTGESTPVSKISAPRSTIESLNEIAIKSPKELLKHYLFCKTKLIKVRRPVSKDHKQEPALAMVVRTGFNTTKGVLIRSILFQKIPNFRFYKDSLRYIAVMATIAFIGLIINTIRFINMGIKWNLIILRTLDLITIIVPPALPATLTIGTNFAISRLKKRQIYCISPSKINISGTIDIVCFDKTGTLTEDGLDVLGIRVVEESSNRLGKLHKDFLSLPFYASNYNNLAPTNKGNAMLYTMATCHSIRLLNNDLIGDSLDLKMFNFTEWTYEENQEYVPSNNTYWNSGNQNIVQDPNALIISSIVKPKKDLRINDIRDLNFENASSFELGIVKSFEFVSCLRRMSVIVKEFNSPDMQVYLKGAPEIMKNVCNLDSLPDNYEEILFYYTSRGFRVIACAMKTLPGASWIKTQKMSREEIEKNLLFIGFIIFENKLKPSSSKIINILNNADIRCVMCTGDNILTSISVSRQCNIIQKDEDVYMATIHGDVNSPDSIIVWENADNPEMRLDNDTLLPQYISSNINDFLYYKTCPPKKYSLAITDDVFKWMIKFSPYSVFERMLVKTQIFSRMSPDEKQLLVEKLQSLDYCLCFCGDGANDCAALKAANVGISLSEAEASVVSPFTYKNFDITCVFDLIREGRAALVTSFSCFKYMTLYSAIQFISTSILYSSASNLGDFQYLYIDLILVLPIAISVGRSQAYSKLVKEQPVANLVSEKVIGSLIGNIIILLLLQLAVLYYVRFQDWYEKPSPRSDFFDISNSDNSSLFTFSCHQYILVAIILSIGPPYRQPIYYNKLFVFFVLVSFISVSFILYNPSPWMSSLLELSYLKFDFCFFITDSNISSNVSASISKSDPFFNVYQGLIGNNRNILVNYWQNTIRKIENDNHDFKTHQIPLARIKKVMKTDENVKMISTEAPILFAKSCDIFITELTLRAWIHAQEDKRRTLQKSDIANAISKSDMFDFLLDIISKEDLEDNSKNAAAVMKNASKLNFISKIQYLTTNNINQNCLDAYSHYQVSASDIENKVYGLQNQAYILKQPFHINHMHNSHSFHVIQ